MPIIAVAAAELPPIVVTTLPTTAAKAGAANPPALPLQYDCNYTEHRLHLHHAYDGDTQKTQHLIMQP